ncbi:cell division protein CrgA [Euzebya tangerina]|uniref:cell division protein CrgA n=1 Tax=Euzebya tangerina TaxID=591198 RepID=UPI0013C35A6F|nr:cell division protein CrgA [Euzebya tangerina]
MAKSKSKRDQYKPPPQAKPPPSPTWVPIAGTGLIGSGIVVILLTYLLRGSIPGGNLWIIGGFIFMAAGLVILSRWR